jgi:hypothetical protein
MRTNHIVILPGSKQRSDSDLRRATEESQPASLIAAGIKSSQSLGAVRWSPLDRAWIYARVLAAQRLYNDQSRDTVRPVDRRAGKQMVRTALRTALPNEEFFLAMPEMQARIQGARRREAVALIRRCPRFLLHGSWLPRWSPRTSIRRRSSGASLRL